MILRVGSLTADDVISFKVSNYDEEFDGTERDNSWLRRLEHCTYSSCIFFEIREFRMKNQEDVSEKPDKGEIENYENEKDEDNPTKADDPIIDQQKVIQIANDY